MSEYRRAFVPGGTYFFTVVTHLRRPILTAPTAIDHLRTAFRTIQADRPFRIEAIVILPDHLHALWTLPENDSDYSTRWRRIKEEFTKSFLTTGGTEGQCSASRRRRKERGVWQRRYWEHTIRDETDFERHADYIHYNPVKHGFVTSPKDWPHSSFPVCVKKGYYDLEWGAAARGALSFDELDETAME